MGNKSEKEKGLEIKKESSKELEARMNLYVYVILGLIILLIAGILVYFIWNNINSHFIYQGMEFNRIIKNNEKVYATSFITKSMFNGIVYIDNRTFYLRNNPPYLNSHLDKKIEGKLPIIADRQVYVSINEPLPNCKDRVRALFDISASLVNYGLNITGGVLNKTKSQQNYTELTCLNSTINTVIIISQGNYTGYTQIKDNCYEISFEECEDMSKATEGFTLKLLERMAATLELSKKN